MAKYSWRVLSAKQLQAELEAFTGTKFGDLFEQWVYGRGLTDWAVSGVTVDDPMTRPGPLAAGQRAKGGCRVQVRLTQNREVWEPTSVGFKFAGGDGYTLRVPVGGMNDTVQKDQDVSLETLHLLARVVARRIKPTCGCQGDFPAQPRVVSTDHGLRSRSRRSSSISASSF